MEKRRNNRGRLGRTLDVAGDTGKDPFKSVISGGRRGKANNFLWGKAEVGKSERGIHQMI